MTELELIEQTHAKIGRPVTSDLIASDLRGLGVQPGMVLLLHSSLKSLGWVNGGVQAVVAGLRLAVGESGTLVMPTQSSNLGDPEHWRNPPVPEEWKAEIRRMMPAYDPALTQTWWMGAIPEYYRRLPGVLRSSHPHTSFAAGGAQAAAIIGNHALDFALGEGSPLARIYELGGYVLLLGVGHGNNTSLHLAEHRATYPSKEVVKQHAPMLVDGVRQWVTYRDINEDANDFPKIGAAFAATGLERVGQVGCATARLMPQRELVDFGVQWIEANRQ